MRARRLTAADVCEVTGYNRDQLRALLGQLPGWSDAPGERKARHYSAHDLIVLSVAHALDRVIGMRRPNIALVLPHLRKVLSGPKAVSANARLVITFAPLCVEYVDGNATVAEGVTVLLQPILDRVDEYLGATRITKTRITKLSTESQVDLGLGPGLVRGRRRRMSGSQ